LGNYNPGDAAYFMHSFMALPEKFSHRVDDCIYGGHRTSAIICRDSIMGYQFHPEINGEVRLKIFRKFIIQ